MDDAVPHFEHPSPPCNWSNDSLFFTYEWTDETSQFDNDPSVRWNGGPECYTRTFRARVPLAFSGCDDLIDMWIEYMMDHHPECEGFWR